MSQRWGAEAPTSAADARLRLVAAASRCIDRFGLAKTTLEDVATEAAVSRQTIYRYFANRDELLLDALLSELERAELEQPFVVPRGQIRTPDDVAEAMVEILVHTLEVIRRSPKLSSLLVAEKESVRSTLDGASARLFDYLAVDIVLGLEAAQAVGFVRAELDVNEAAEWIIRAGLSILTVPGPVERDSAELRRFLTTFLRPALIPDPRGATA
jgi:AcrR family transcriptional regulator